MFVQPPEAYRWEPQPFRDASIFSVLSLLSLISLLFLIFSLNVSLISLPLFRERLLSITISSRVPHPDGWSICQP